MQQSPIDKLTRNQRATLTGLSALAINHARKVLGRSFGGGEDWEFVKAAQSYKEDGSSNSSRSFTK